MKINRFTITSGQSRIWHLKPASLLLIKILQNIGDLITLFQNLKYPLATRTPYRPDLHDNSPDQWGVKTKGNGYIESNSKFMKPIILIAHGGILE